MSLLNWVALKFPIENGKSLEIGQDSLSHAIVAAALDKNDHGVISAGILLKNLAYFQEGDLLNAHNKDRQDNFKIATRASILKAISLHNLSGTLFHEWDLTMLLFLCDELQDWDRPTSKEREMPAETKISLEKLAKEEIIINICRTLNIGNNLTYARHKFRRFIEALRNDSSKQKREFCFDVYVTHSLDLEDYQREKAEIEEVIINWKKDEKEWHESGNVR